MDPNERSPASQSVDEEERTRVFKRSVKSRSTWPRLFFMIVVAILYEVSRVVVCAVVVVQFFWVLFTGETNKKLEQLGHALATYAYQSIRYLTFTTEERPFPFDADWPAGLPAR